MRASNQFDSKTKTLDLSLKVKNLTKILAIIPPLIYGFLNLNNIEYISLINEKYIGFYLNSGLILMYFTWLYGGLFDLRIYEIILILDDNKKVNLNLIDWIISSMIIVVYCAMTYFKFNSFHLYSLYTIFWALNIFGFHYFMKFKIYPIIKNSEDLFNKNKDYWSLVRVGFLKQYCHEKWIYIRLYIFFIISLALALVSSEKYFPLSDEQKNILPLLFPIIIITSESWVWYKRISMKESVKASLSISDEYKIEKSSND